MMFVHASHTRDYSKRLLKAFNKRGSCASYQTIKSVRNILTTYALKCLEKNTHAKCFYQGILHNCRHG